MENSMNASTDTGVTTSNDVDYKSLYEASEKGKRNAQAELTPVQQENARLRAELAVQSSTPSIDAAEQDRLNDLMYTDPQAWRQEINKSEIAQAEVRKAAIDSKTEEIQSEMTAADVTRRTGEFFASRPDIDATTVIESMPKALQQMIEKGEISLEDGLQRGVNLVNGATVKSVLAPSSPDLAAVAGSKEPTDGAKQQQASKDWGTALV